MVKYIEYQARNFNLFFINVAKFSDYYILYNRFLLILRKKVGFMIKILTIDDEEIIRFTISGLLEDHGYEVFQAADGFSGIEAFKTHKPDLVLVDIKMPNMSGLEVIKHITKLTTEVPIIVISGTNSLREAMDAIHNGAWDYLTKPIIDLNVLQHVIEKSLEKARLIEENNRYKQSLEHEIELRTDQLRTRTIELEKTNRDLEKEIDVRIETEKKIQQTLSEKELLIKEVHHRVKNNLQIISSILNLQLRTLKDDFSKNIFVETQSRVKSMALVHEKLYGSDNLEEINFRDYIQGLVCNLRTAFGFKKPIKIECQNTDDEELLLNIDIAIPTGLIINEVVTNSIKYAFQEPSEDDMIFIRYHFENDLLSISLGDNGKGVSEDIDIKKSKTLGLQLITILSSQLNGDLQIDKEDGLVFNLKFPITVKSRI